MQRFVHVRMPPVAVKTLRRAAELTGRTLNEFVVQAAVREAQSVMEREGVIRMSSRDWNWLLALIEAPPKPNEKLQAALNRRMP